LGWPRELTWWLLPEAKAWRAVLRHAFPDGLERDVFALPEPDKA
jgi:hypothetical protein